MPVIAGKAVAVDSPDCPGGASLPSRLDLGYHDLLELGNNRRGYVVDPDLSVAENLSLLDRPTRVHPLEEKVVVVLTDRASCSGLLKGVLKTLNEEVNQIVHDTQERIHYLALRSSRELSPKLETLSKELGVDPNQILIIGHENWCGVTANGLELVSQNTNGVRNSSGFKSAIMCSEHNWGVGGFQASGAERLSMPSQTEFNPLKQSLLRILAQM